MISCTLFESVNGHCMCFVLSKFNSLYQFRKLHWLFDIKASKKQLLRLFFLHSAYISLSMEGRKFHSRKLVLCLFSITAQSLLASNWDISSNIQIFLSHGSGLVPTALQLVPISSSISEYTTHRMYSLLEKRGQGRRSKVERHFLVNKLKVIKNFVATVYFWLIKLHTFLFKAAILQFFPPPPNFPSNTDILQMFLGGNKSLLQNTSKSPARKGQSEMKNWRCDHVLLPNQSQELEKFTTDSYKERPRRKTPWAEQVGVSPRHF